ncbi:hypothetical protein NLG97_g2254 [Lecanicillium saksenae]|uniref:Uncharacterized protein n=1 Tax=Lecanicillium saksenae TaxID=468837 RepID=A0ACC1R421_9HYPO|nr:hypothetical protein NLG97_g2254 [Lecanicillium saksenae]
MSDSASFVRSIKTRDVPERRYAEQLIKTHHRHTSSRPAKPGQSLIRVVCISDTHNTHPAVPDGDILIHAGDLTENGSFEEKYKIFIAGNHDVLFDDVFLQKYPERRYGQTKTKDDLIWGDIIYLQDESVTLEFPSPERNDDGTGTAEQSSRSITILYHPNNFEHWETILGSLSKQPDVIVTHGPPRHHLDKRDFHRAGCPHLAREIRRIRPRLCVFGHIHAAYGREHVLFDAAQAEYEEILTGWAGWVGVLRLGLAVLWSRVAYFLNPPRSTQFTTLVNAAVVGGLKNTLQNEPIVVEL